MSKLKNLRIRDILLLDKNNLDFINYLYKEEKRKTVTYVNKNTGEEITLEKVQAFGD